MINESNQNEITIITHDQNGQILAQETYVGEYGDKFTTIIGEDLMTDGGKRELALQTLDESGNIIASHTLLVDGEAESYKNIIEKFQKGKIHGFKKDGKIVKKYTMCPLILGNYFLI